MTSNRAKAFTLTELLIVMGIILIVSLIAVPSFRALTGGRSTEAAQNQLASFLQRARQEAIGAQEVRGIAFFMDPDSGRPKAVMVREVSAPTVPRTEKMPKPFTVVETYLDLVPDREHLIMPTGVGIQVIDDCNLTAGGSTPSPHDDVRADDAYIGMNDATANGAPFTYGGAVLFDGFGRLVSRQYAFKCFRQLPDPSSLTGFSRTPTELADFLHMKIPATDTFGAGGSTDFKPGITKFDAAGNEVGPWINSCFGFVLFDQDAFDNQFNENNGRAGDRDPQCDPAIQGGNYTDQNAAAWQAGTNSTNADYAEAKEERWLDDNAVPILVNRANGTLMRGQ